MKEKIMIVDDHEDIREVVHVLLTNEGYQIIEAKDGKEALELLDDEIDLIILDVMMPEMNGYEATKAIRAMNDRPDGKNIPIIAMTANSFAEDVQASLDAGMNAHLSKPIVIEEVIKTILRYVHND